MNRNRDIAYTEQTPLAKSDYGYLVFSHSSRTLLSKKESQTCTLIIAQIQLDVYKRQVLPYVRSAREGVRRLGSLLEQYGTYEMNGNRALIKREKFERYLDQATAV